MYLVAWITFTIVQHAYSLNTIDVRDEIHLDVKNDFPQRVADFFSAGRRIAEKDIYIDVALLVDYPLYQRWFEESGETQPELRRLTVLRDIKSHFVNIIKSVEISFKSASPRYNIRISGIFIQETPQSKLGHHVTDNTSAHGQTEVLAQIMLESIWKWTSVRDFPENDHVMVFTDQKLFALDGNDKIDLSGIAFLGELCRPNGKSISMVGETGMFRTDVIATAHELAHSFGAHHDGENNSCNDRDNFIMSSSHDPGIDVTSGNAASFSPCSVDYFQQHVDFLAELRTPSAMSCLYDQINGRIVSYLKSTLPGQLHDVHQQCLALYTSKSYFCMIKGWESESVCTLLPCYNPETKQCVYHTSKEGTSCGNRKWCESGNCVYSVNAPEKHKDCVFGNRPGPVYQSKDCKQTITGRGYLCYNPLNRQLCCETCLMEATGTAGCEYGNNYWNMTSCDRNKCKTSPQYNELCCKTCTPTSATGTTALTDSHPKDTVGLVTTPTTNVETPSEEASNTAGQQPPGRPQAMPDQPVGGTRAHVSESARGPDAVSRNNDPPGDVISYDSSDFKESTTCVDNRTLQEQNGITCVVEVSWQYHLCYNATYLATCCRTCRQHNSLRTGCEFGDRDPTLCTTLDWFSCCDYSSTCCNTCSDETQPLMCAQSVASQLNAHSSLDSALQLLVVFTIYNIHHVHT